MDAGIYQIEHIDQLITPALIYYKDLIIENIEKSIKIAGGPRRLWPHVKTHKTREITTLSIEHGITRFKCATIAEAEMVASCGPTDIIVAYPLVGPNPARFITLQQVFPRVRFWAIGDDLNQVKRLDELAHMAGVNIHFMIDVNVGQNRTGVAVDQVVDFYESVAAMDNVKPDGMHCYDGHIHDADLKTRTRKTAKIMDMVTDLKKRITQKGYSCENLVMGGTPTFPCYIEYPHVFVSPGTVFLSDYGYGSQYTELGLTAAGVVMTRVVSHPASGTFTLDLGYKGLASDPDGVRGCVVGMEDSVISVSQNEEHWIFKMAPGHENELPAVGTELFVIPTHICPTSALYPSVPVVVQGKITEYWEIAARNRKITI